MVHLVDSHVGKKIRQRRWLLDMTQQQLAEAVGIKFQQIQKYETGANRVSASRLWDISEVLGIPVAAFFEGVNRQDPAPQSDTCILPDDPLEDKEAIALIRSYYGIPQSERRRLVDLARVLSDVG